MRLRRLGKVLLYSLACLIGAILLLMLAVKLALDRAPAYQAEIKAWVHKSTGYHVGFASVSPAFRWYGPELYFTGLELRSRDDQRVLARAHGGRVAADIWELVRHGRLLAGHIEIDSPALSITRLGPARFALASEIELGGENPGAAALNLEDLPAGSLAIRGAVVSVKAWNAALPELTLRNVSVDLRHEAGLSLIVTAQMPAALGGELTLRTRASGTGAWKGLQWTALARLKDLSFPGWGQLLPEYLNGLESGIATFNVTAGGSGGELQRADLEFAARDVSMQLADGPLAKFDQMSGALALSHAADRWSLSGRRVRAARRDPESSFDASWRYGEYGLLDLSMRASYVRAETLLPLTGFLPQPDVRDELRAYAPTGEWTDTVVSMTRSDSQGPWRLQLQGRFRNAGFAAVRQAPGIRGLSGSFAGSEQAGHVRLEGDGGVFNWPAQFPAPIPLLNLKTAVFWRRDQSGLLVATPGFAFRTPDVEASGQLSWLQPVDGSSPVLTLVGHLQNGSIVNAKNYLPKGRIPPPALNWLNLAFTAGRVSHAEVVLNGPVRRFPFRDGGGLFLARVHVEGVTLNYFEDWAPAENVTALAEFRNEGVSVHATGGHLGALQVTQAEARFADFKTGELNVKASTRSDASDILSYLRLTPLDAMAERAFSHYEASGMLDTTATLFLPFKDFAHRRTLIHGHLSEGVIGKPDVPAKATRVSGDFDVDGAQLAQADLHGELLGGAFQAQARAPRNRPLTRTQLEMRGTLDLATLRRTFELPQALDVSGEIDWRAVLKMAPDPARERSLRISSTLAGAEIRLPAPLNKAAGTPMPSYVELQWPGFGGLQGMMALGSLASGSFSFATAQDDYRLTRLTLNFGEGGAGGNDNQILNVGGAVERVDLAGWLDLNKSGKGGRPLSYFLKNAALNIAELDYLGLAFRDVSVGLQVQDSGLRVNVGGPNVSGSIHIPNAASEAWNLQFDQVRFEAAGRDEDAGAPLNEPGAGGLSDPRSVPALNFHAAHLIWGERRFGDVRATFSRLDDGIRLQDLTATGPTFGVKATGEWRGAAPGDARIVGSIISSDVLATMKDLGYADVMEAKSGKMDFDLHWGGPPSPAALAGVGGKVTLAFDKGQIIGIKPGAGRVLGLTSIAALPRRLFLDFSDLTDKGLAFDTVRGDFELRDGNAYTDDVLLKGPAAEVGLIGRVGLKSRDYDQTAVVTGNISSTLPLAALVGGPVVAGAVLVFTQVFKQPLKGLARGYYRITGGWDNPTVERIKGSDAPTTAEAPR